MERGGAPDAFDRLLATLLDATAIEHGVLAGFLKGEIANHAAG